MRINKLILIKHSEQCQGLNKHLLLTIIINYLTDCTLFLCFTKMTDVYGYDYQLVMINLFRKKIFLIKSRCRDKFDITQSWLKTVGPSPIQLVGINTRESFGIPACEYSPKFLPGMGFRNDGYYLYPVSLKGRKWGEMVWPCVIRDVLGNNICSRKRMTAQSWTLGSAS